MQQQAGAFLYMMLQSASQVSDTLKISLWEGELFTD